ncbi:putative ubiquitin-like protein [Trypanosoma vivax]|uniref:Putative ubiquitin-like protein n=1 Tax=Trypanosoma vivax (strain Y486) TaxID=1055687 RepID=G0U6E8_TRYVY|nr:putative ubiquitin-like protein [Trypanosoma vivax]CCC51452.1 putative ubiquitin-like protein [Trypanosoma vivax Y486]
MSVVIKLSDGSQKTLNVPDLNITVVSFMELAVPVIGIPVDEQRVVLRGKVLKHTDVLSAVGLEHGQAVHIVRGKRSTSSVSPATTTSTQPTSQTNPPNSGRSAIGLDSSAGAPNPYMALAGNLPLAAGLTSGMAASGGFNFPFSLDSMAQMMQDPVISNAMREFMSDPQIMQQLFPSMTDNNNMGMHNLVSNPIFMQQAMQLFSNPSLMHRMMQILTSAPGSQGQSEFSEPSSSNPQPPNELQGSESSRSHGDPRVIYQSQLQQLREMGFTDDEANLTALQQVQGNVCFAIERLLNR